MEEIKVTIGIPVYNVEKYIETCVTSVLEQTLESIEIIIVDDKGTDNTIEVVKRLAKEHPRGNCIRILEHQKNMGVANGRNTIIDNARGKYLYLIDSDDFIIKNAIEILYNKAEELEAETTWGSMKEVHADTGKEGVYRLYPDLELLGENALMMFECQNLKETLQHSVCNILYRLDFIRENNLRFEEYGGYDDTLFHAMMQPHVKRAVLMSVFTYIYYKRPNSISKFNYRKEFRVKEAYDAIEASEKIIAGCKDLMDKPYIDVKCAKVMKQALFMLCGVLKHRDQMIDGQITDKRLKQWYQHPASFLKILSFKKYKLLNLGFWIIGKLPSNIMVALLKVIGKRKGYL